jgi:hypothetical protein
MNNMLFTITAAIKLMCFIDKTISQSFKDSY